MTLVDKLAAKGVCILNPNSVWIGEDVDPDRIEKGVVIHPGCRIQGEKTLILSGAVIGSEAPATVHNCFIGPDVSLKGGFFKGSVFLEGAQMGSGAHVREGTILEEAASGAHAVGLKQTILFPFVTLGSLINFCDCFMSGGTSRKNHSEVGSSYIHFNYTPNQDKATPSLLGDVPHGVMLDQDPIFLGGQGGLVGPCRIGFGNTIAAGGVYRKDEPGTGQLLIGAVSRGGRVPFKRGAYQNIPRIVTNNAVYIANLLALKQWYQCVRPLFISDRFPIPLHEGLGHTLSLAVKERIHRLEEFLGKANLAASQTNSDQTDGTTLSRTLLDEQRRIMDRLEAFKNEPPEDRTDMMNFLNGLKNKIQQSKMTYIKTIQSLDPDLRRMGVHWLQAVVDRVIQGTFESIPALQITEKR
jgi:bifunctional UDP-N-acetylglucosamine pyrophosphorylase / glucosamine-1-phosphate N-acetyltransferase